MAVCLCVVIMAATGCNSDKNVEQETETQRAIMEEAQKIEDSIDKRYNDGFTWTELSHTFPNKDGGNCVSGGGSKGDTSKYYSYGRRIVYVGDLVTDDNVKSIEYSLSNCVGSFMDDSYYESKESPKTMILKLENKPYLLEGSDQSSVYFAVYYYYYDPTKVDYQSQGIQAQECMKYLRITLDITFEDGTKETRMYGIRFTRENYYDAKHMQIYMLE